VTSGPPRAATGAAPAAPDTGPAGAGPTGAGPTGAAPAHGGPARGGRLAATVAGEAVWAADVDAELDRLRAGPQAGRLPAPGTQDGRQLRRWVAQRVVLRRLLEQEARTLPRGDGPGVHCPETPFRPDPAVLGAATADVLATSPAARAVYAAVTAAEAADEADLLAYYRRNLDRYTTPDRWAIRAARSVPDLATTTPVPIDPGTLPRPIRSALATAGPGQVIAPASGAAAGAWAGGYVVLDAVLPGGARAYEDARDEVAAVVLGRRRQVAFARWLDARAAAVVTLEPGYEHPADPGNPDATHRH
jgi:[acyl-carrier-protein] S-malonyltransferase